MDRIESLDGSYLSGRSRRKKDKSTKKLQGRSFETIVEQATEGGSPLFDADVHADHGSNLEELLDEVHQSGEMLIENQSMNNIKRYRQAVTAFLDYVVSKMLTVEEQTSGGNILRRKRFTQVKIIDNKLERLVGSVLQNQGKQLDLLDRVNEIRGLLIDLIT
ncbi:MAG: DUF327 family protein [Spirochaetaceae bacterium]|nr:MAG: DUF327 family protein [Spirochaetaceae bacterium]